MELDTNNPFEVVGIAVSWGLPTVAVGVGTAWAAFKVFGKTWLDAAFAKELKKLEAREQAALKHIQESIDHQIHRAKKLYDIECWRRPRFDPLVRLVPTEI